MESLGTILDGWKKEHYEILKAKGNADVDKAASNSIINRLHDVSIDSVGRNLPDVGDYFQHPFPPDIKNVK